ncbi:VOC family protein [Bradyrhizobium sp. AUGA SZCCT0042]|uniref:VOC family protein n=1 Tax=Bradyrhizobium sp. AUGA SZCCT0042 TaxID=2807651 RepID=UPI001BAA72E9|nr:VOC family protein [Bradyrhizobium sp. AUGA SZCCT0042]MBR1297370.1 VOC family protein [Bradyrhizobium sp. AUGA SZCCT0042]
MAIVGIQTILFGVDDLNKWSAFFEDFGLTRPDGSNAGAISYVLPEGSQITLRHSSDPSLPPAFLATDGPREVIWGVDSQGSLDRIEHALRTDRPVTKDADGTLHSIDPNGIRIGFRLFVRRPFQRVEGSENAVGNPVRWNKRRSWYSQARPKVIQHIVFGVPDIDAGVAFYCERLGFRISDISRGLGVFMRCDGRHDHHNLFLPKAEKIYFHHVSFGVDNIDELMAGANHMQRKGWPGGHGLGRHRVSSMIFYYLKSPSSGEIEYSADGDAVDDNWEPSLWSPKFGNIHWVGSVTDVQMTPADYDLTPLPKPIPAFSQLK